MSTRLPPTDQLAIALRNGGFTYQEIGNMFDIPAGKAWIMCNRDEHNKGARESGQRYRDRGYVALCDT